jgi:hypothetical protein
MVSTLVACAEPAGTLTTEDARGIIEEQWNQPDVGILLGDIQFVDGKTEAAKGREAIKELPIYRAIAQKGIIAITNEQDLRTGSTARKDAEALRAAGVQRTAHIELTEAGKKLGNVKRVGAFDELFLSVVPSKIQSITAGDSVVSGKESYREFTGTHVLNVPADLKPAMEAARGSMEPRRFRALLKYDQVADVWSVAAMDIARAEQAFTTNNVERRLAEVRQGKPRG